MICAKVHYHSKYAEYRLATMESDLTCVIIIVRRFSE